jgi:hypothetical protein
MTIDIYFERCCILSQNIRIPTKDPDLELILHGSACGSGIFFPDPGSWIRFFLSRIQICIQEFKYFLPKKLLVSSQK